MAMLVCGSSTAHELTPTYPKLLPYYIGNDIHYTSMQLFNRRSDVQYYEIQVFDQEWNVLPFAASSGKIMNIPYLETKRFDIYVHNKNIKDVTYICTVSKLIKQDITSAISSKICSKIKRD